jgi:hypothetical protein
MAYASFLFGPGLQSQASEQGSTARGTGYPQVNHRVSGSCIQLEKFILSKIAIPNFETSETTKMVHQFPSCRL